MTDERLAKEASVLMHTYEDYAGIRAKLLKEKEQSQDEIASISERIEDLIINAPTGDRDKKLHDEITKAKDKRKRLREKITETNFKVRDCEIQIKRVELEPRLLLGGIIVDED